MIGLLDTLERDRSLRDPLRWRERLELLDRLELYTFDAGAQRRADALRDMFEHINDQFYGQLRDAIRQGNGKTSLWPLLCESAEPDTAVGNRADGYDHLDELVSGVLQFQQPEDAQVVQPPEMVFYQPTPARHVGDLIRRLNLGAQDILMDLGSGLGHVPLLVAICTDAHCYGVEREPSYAECFRQCASSLGLSNATSIERDARQADFARATVFYMYTPFTGGVMRTVLDRLEQESSRRAIRIAAYGPCTSVVAHERWLQPIGALKEGRVALFGVPR